MKPEPMEDDNPAKMEQSEEEESADDCEESMEEENVEDEEEDDEEEDDDEEETNDAEVKKEVYLPGKEIEKGEQLTVDMSAYRLLHKAQTGSPCLSFDVILDDLGSSRETYPMTMYLVAGTQAPRTHVNNLIVMKMTNLTGSNETKESDNESDEDDDDDDDEEKMPKMSVASIKHQGCVNRVRCTQVSGKTFAASWSELGRINLWNLDEQLKAINNPTLLSAYNKKLEKQDDCVKPIFTFKGHSSEGYGIDWCKTEQGVLATGDCKGNIHIWKPSNATWNVDQRPYNSHAPQSVEDIQWSPSEKNILASCSVDKSIKIWDTRVSPQTACKLTAVDAHDADVNVISWNPKESRFIVSGGDDGVVKVWDLRQFGKNNDSAVAIFKQHTAPVTTVEWHPDEATVFATGGSDDQIAQWDLSVEPDQDNEKDNDIGDLPPQLLFIHQGQSDVKELHWHPQCPGVMISTAHSGFNVFRTISV